MRTGLWSDWRKESFVCFISSIFQNLLIYTSIYAVLVGRINWVEGLVGQTKVKRAHQIFISGVTYLEAITSKEDEKQHWFRSKYLGALSSGSIMFHLRDRSLLAQMLCFKKGYSHIHACIFIVSLHSGHAAMMIVRKCRKWKSGCSNFEHLI